MRPENTASRRNLVSLAGCSAARHAKRRYGVFPYGRQSEPKADRLSEVRIGAVGSACPPDPTPRVCNIRRRGLLDSPLEGDRFELLVPPGRNSTRAPCGFRASLYQRHVPAATASFRPPMSSTCNHISSCDCSADVPFLRSGHPVNGNIPLLG